MGGSTVGGMAVKTVVSGAAGEVVGRAVEGKISSPLSKPEPSIVSKKDGGERREEVRGRGRKQERRGEGGKKREGERRKREGKRERERKNVREDGRGS